MNSQYFENIFNVVMQDDRYRGEMVAAKGEFERMAGQIMESDESFEARVNAFHNWYILDRTMSGPGQTPLQYFLDYNANGLPADVVTGYNELLENLHSVFELLKFSNGRASMRNLLSRKKHRVEGAGQLDSLERGDLFNTRLFRHGGEDFLTNYLILHPNSVRRMIKGEAKKVRKTGENPKAFLFRLLFFHSRWEQFAQMDVDKIYRFGATVNGQHAI